MSTRTIVAGRARCAFFYSILCTAADFFLLKDSFVGSLSYGIATFVGSSAYLITDALVAPRVEYIDERAEEDN